MIVLLQYAALAALMLGLAEASPQPTIRIGLTHRDAAVTLSSSEPFTVQQQTTRSASFTLALAVDASVGSRVLGKNDLRYRMMVELDGGRYLALPLDAHVRVPPPISAHLQVGDRSYRGAIEIFGNTRNTLTVVNELSLEDYLLGVVPNELSPAAFGQPEALKAQAVAARTYAVKNMGQSKQAGYDICDTDACQVYMGAGTEDPVATAAVRDTSGMTATYHGQPIDALYSSTCGGRTESAENIFDERLPYLVSVPCEYKHPAPKPFLSSRLISEYKDAVLAVAGVSDFSELRSFLGITSGRGEPPSLDVSSLATWLRQNFYPNVKPRSDLDFMVEQGILPGSGRGQPRDVMFHVIEKKGAFEWQQGILMQWDGETLRINAAGKTSDYRVGPDALFFFRVGDELTAMKNGEWIGGELMDFRAVNGVVQMIVYRKNWVNPAADRYSRLAEWQVHKTKQDLEAAFRSLNLGEIRDIRARERGPSERPVATEITGTRGTTTVRALRLRTLLGLRDSLFYFDQERNERGDLIGITFYGQGWGHGVGMCQVGAFGMALDGASYSEILKHYYSGIEVTKAY